MKCKICGTSENVRKFKHIPFSNGRNGYATLSDWTNYCADCIRNESEIYTAQIDNLLKSRQ